MADDVAGKALLDAALCVLLERAGGDLTYTQSEYLAIKARRGPYRIVGTVDKSGTAEPRIEVQLVAAPIASPDPVN